MSTNENANRYIKIVLTVLIVLMIKTMIGGGHQAPVTVNAPIDDDAPVKAETLANVEPTAPPASRETPATAQAPVTTLVGNSRHLVASGPITVNRDGQIVEGFNITSMDGAGITINGFKNVIIRNCKITVYKGPGILAAMADGLQIQNVDVKNGSASVGLRPNVSRFFKPIGSFKQNF